MPDTLPAAFVSDVVVVTATRTPPEVATPPASVTIIDADGIDRLAPPLLGDLLRLVPSLSVSTSGPAGSLTDVRIRGAEANHSLLFVEGIRANDPAAGNAPRFELLNADLASRIEVVRGPQSALWGSEAIGGVVAVSGPAPGEGGSLAMAEAGSFGFRRGALRTTIGDVDRGLSLGLASQRADGIDSFSGQGDKDGYRNLSGRVAGTFRVAPTLLLGGSGFAERGSSQFDGFDPLTFQHADTLDNSRNRIGAARLYALLGAKEHDWLRASASLLGSSNRNFLGDDPVNRTAARRRTATIEGGLTRGRHALFAAIEDEREAFSATDTAYGGLSDQRHARDHRSLTLEWTARDLGPVSTDIALRHDIFSAFRDATTLRAGATVRLDSQWSVAATFGQGIAQPTFFDLYGFFPGSFVGNRRLAPEKSSGEEASLRYRGATLSGAVTLYRQRLHDEIVDLFDPVTFLSTTGNARGTSHRRGVEVEGAWRPSPAFGLAATYAFLDASEPTAPDGGQLKEQRRPRHSGSIAIDGSHRRITYGAAIAYTGAHVDTDFDTYPAARVRLDSYWLASARLAYRLTDTLDATLRVANAFDASYQDVVGYRTEGRSVDAGIRLALGR